MVSSIINECFPPGKDCPTLKSTNTSSEEAPPEWEILCVVEVKSGAPNNDSPDNPMLADDSPVKIFSVASKEEPTVTSKVKP